MNIHSENIAPPIKSAGCWNKSNLSNLYYDFQSVADRLGVPSAFMEYDLEHKESNPDAGLYLVLAPTINDVKRMEWNPELLESSILDNKHCDDMILMNACTIRMTKEDLSNQNLFPFYQETVRQIQYYASALNAYREIGCAGNMPAFCWKSYVEDFDDLDRKRHNMAVSQDIRNNYDTIYKNQIRRVAAISEHQERANDDYFKKTDLFQTKNKDGVNLKTHRVANLNYFVDHKMDICTREVGEYFLEYLEKKIPESKYFVYWRSKEPTMVLENISDINQNAGNKNIWKHNTGYKKYSVAFPRCYLSQFCKWNLEFNTRNYDLVPIPELLEQSRFHKLYPVQVAYKDLQNFNSLCQANNVKLSVDFDNYLRDKDFGPDDVETVEFWHRREDYDMVVAIQKRLMNERATYVQPGLRGKELPSSPRQDFSPKVPVSPHITTIPSQNKIPLNEKEAQMIANGFVKAGKLPDGRTGWIKEREDIDL